MWHLGQASRDGDVTKAKQLVRRLMDKAVLKEAVQRESNHPLRSGMLCWFIPRTMVLVWGSCVLFTGCANDQSPVVPFIIDWFYGFYYLISSPWSDGSFDRYGIHEKQMEYKYPKGKSLTDEEARELLRKDMEAKIDALKREGKASMA